MKIIEQSNKIKEVIEELFQIYCNMPIEFVYSEKLFNYLLKTKDFTIIFRGTIKEEYKCQGYIRLFNIIKVGNIYRMTIRPNENPDPRRKFDISYLL